MTWLLLICSVIFLLIGGFFTVLGVRSLYECFNTFIPDQYKKPFIQGSLFDLSIIGLGFCLLFLVYWCWTYLSQMLPFSNVIRYYSKWLM